MTLLYSRHTQSGMTLHLQQLQHGSQPTRYFKSSRVEFRIWFQRFYYKLCNSNLIGTAVLSTRSTDSLQKSCWYVIRAPRNVITWMDQITEWLPAILDYMSIMWDEHINVPSHPYPLWINRYPGAETLISSHKQRLYFNNTIYIDLLIGCSRLAKMPIFMTHGGWYGDITMHLLARVYLFDPTKILLKYGKLGWPCS